MNLVIFCAIILLPASLAFVVKFYEIDLVRQRINLCKPSLVCTQHRFEYQRGDNFTMYLRLNKTHAPTVTNATAVVKHYTGASFNETLKHFFEITDLIEEHLTYDKIIIDVELINDNECQRHTILEGMRKDEVPEPLEAVNKTTNKNMCLNGNSCFAVISAADICRDAETSYFIVIVSSVAAVILVSLVIFSILHFCWKKYNSPGSQQIVPTNQNRYYENILFGPDSLQEINLQEQRASVRPSPEPQYEEINDYLNHG